MTIPAYVSAGAGTVGNLGATLEVAYPGSLVAGYTIWAQVMNLSDDTAYDDSALLSAGFTLAPDGEKSFGDSSEDTARVYRMTSAGTESGTVAIGSPTGGFTWARMYATSGSASSGEYAGSCVQTLDHSNSVGMPSLASPNTDQAAGLAFVFVAQSTAIGSATGESGGDWTEAVAEYSATQFGLVPGTLQLQTTSLASQSISGGASSLGISPYWSVLGFPVFNQVITPIEDVRRLAAMMLARASA